MFSLLTLCFRILTCHCCHCRPHVIQYLTSKSVSVNCTLSLFILLRMLSILLLDTKALTQIPNNHIVLSAASCSVKPMTDERYNQPILSPGFLGKMDFLMFLFIPLLICYFCKPLSRNTEAFIKSKDWDTSVATVWSAVNYWHSLSSFHVLGFT